MSLSDKDKAQLQSKAKDRLLATGLYLYHAPTDRWIPAQCDDEGRLVIDPSDLDTRYLRLDGSRRMTETLKTVGDLLGSKNAIQIGEGDVYLRRYGNDLLLVNVDSSSFRNMRLNILYGNYLQTLPPPGSDFDLRCEKADYSVVDVARIKYHATDPSFEIPLCGTVNMLAGKSLNALAGHIVLPETGVGGDNDVFFEASSRKLWIWNKDDLGWNFVTLSL